MHLALVNPFENTICETLQKVYLLLVPLRLLVSSRICLLSLVIINAFTLLVITILKSILSPCFLYVASPKCSTIQVCQQTYEEI